MTKLDNSGGNSNTLKESTSFALRQLLTAHYPSLSKIFADTDLLKRLEYGAEYFGIEWLRSRLYGPELEEDVQDFPRIRESASLDFFRKLDDVLDDPKGHYEALKDLQAGFDFTDFPVGTVNSMSYMVEGLRSLLLEAHINQIQHSN